MQLQLHGLQPGDGVPTNSLRLDPEPLQHVNRRNEPCEEFTLDVQHWRGEDAGALLPLLPPYRSSRDGRLYLDYYCPGPCARQCVHRRLTIVQAHEQCKEDYARTGRQSYLDQALAYLEYMADEVR